MFNNLSLRVQLIIIFTVCASLSLLIIELISLGYVLGIAFGTKTNIENGILENSKQNFAFIVSDNSLLLDRKFTMASQNFLNVYKIASEDINRNDWPYDNINNYYGWPGYLSTPVIYNSNYNNYMSFSHSSYNVKNKKPEDIALFSQDLLININRTGVNDFITTNLYNNNNIFESIYLALENYELFREYPGATSADTNSILNYNPKTEGWYTNSKINNNKVIFSDLYFDNYVNQYMITLSNSINDIYNGNFIGVVGSDMILSEINNIINYIKYSNDSRTILFENSGTIISDSKRSISNKIYTYKDLTDISISDSLWSNILNNEKYFAEYNSYYIQSNQLNTADGQYILVTLVPQYLIKNTLNPIITEIYNNLIVFGVTACVVFVIIFISSIITIGILTNNIVKPLLKLVKESNKISKNMGNSNIYNEIGDNKYYSNITEAKNLQEKFKELIDKMKNNTNNIEYNINPYYNQNLWDNNQLVINIPEIIPSAPPLINNQSQ